MDRNIYTNLFINSIIKTITPSNLDINIDTGLTTELLEQDEIRDINNSIDYINSEFDVNINIVKSNPGLPTLVLNVKSK